ncbi:MAG: 16S rRNA (cytosine(1402)-N(4))-methyltransferase RsmH [Patescibacteria group bacterium]|jgi:16S rRNA (cytosine1402-N4)-methyltransferase
MLGRTPAHIPVLSKEVLLALAPQAGEHTIDCTLGLGGHAEMLLTATAPTGRLLGIDRDAEALAQAKVHLESFGERVRTVQGTFADIASLAASFPKPNLILADLGLSSFALDTPSRGFSFQADGPLDMRMDKGQGATAAELLQSISAAELERILQEYGEEPKSRAIAKAIIASRETHPIATTGELASVIDATYRQILHAPADRPLWLGRKVHPATRTFQALRIAVNDELGQLTPFLGEAFALLAPGGRLAIISFHSLEDRLVKQFFREQAKTCVCPPEQLQCTCDRQANAQLLIRKPIVASEAELQANPRSRSAKLRVIKKLSPAS